MQQRLEPPVLPSYGRILYATDGSHSAREAGRHAVFLAQRTRAELIVLHLVPNPITRRLSFLLRGIHREERRMARQAVDEIVALALSSGVQVVPAIGSGRRREAIDRAAAKFDVDLIVVASTGDEELKGIFGTTCADGAPLWATRPVCVIMC